MSGSDMSQVRNFALVGHGGDGKTTLADSLAMAAGVTNRLGEVEAGSSFMNYLPEEKARRITISASICTFDREGLEVTIVDTPGDANFAGETAGVLQAVDHAVLVVSASDGVKVGTERSFRLARDQGLSVTAVLNKMDHERADYDGCAEALERSLGARAVKLHLPIGRGENYRGYVDLVAQKAHTFATDGSGREEVGPVPDDLKDEAEEARVVMVEAVAEGDDEILEKYLEEGELTEEEVQTTLAKGMSEGKLLPVFSAAAGRNIGGALLLEAADRFFPSPTAATTRRTRLGEEEVELEADPSAPLAALVFKSVADRYAGMLSILRVFRGTLKTDMAVVNPRTGAKERVTKILQLRGEETSEVKEVLPGGIAALAKLRDTRTLDTLTDDKSRSEVVVIPAPRGVISFAVEAANKGDEDKVFESLNRLVEEDTSLHLGRDERTQEFLLTGLGQLHIEVTLEKLRRMYNVDINLKPPKVPYLETITGRAENIEGKLKKQTGGRGQFGVCYINVEAGERGSGVQFLDEIAGGSIPRQFIPAVEKGIREACTRGVLAGYPLSDLIIHCIDGKHHPVDSSEQAFKTAGSFAIKAAVLAATPTLLEPIMDVDAVLAATPTLLEPIMDVEISVPDDYVGDVMGNLNGRRGRVGGVGARGSLQVVQAKVPMAEMLSYAPDLTSMTGGKGSFSMEFSHYEAVPAQIREKIIAEAQRDKEA
jgi:elongation factor G